MNRGLDVPTVARRSARVSAAFFLAAAWATGALTPAPAAEDTLDPDLEKLIRAGELTAKKLEASPAAWTVVYPGRGGARLSLDVLQMPGKRRWVLWVKNAGRRVDLVRIIERDGLWYVKQEIGLSGKYRPFEAPLFGGGIYTYILRSDPLFVAGPVGQYVRTKDGVALYRTPLTEATRRQVEAAVQQIEQVLRTYPSMPNRDAIEAHRAKLKHLLVDGIEQRVSAATGMLLQHGAFEHEVVITDFRWLARVDEREFAVEGREWEDYSDDLTRGGTADLVMIGHCPTWRPGSKNVELDARILDLRTGRFRRVPFRGTAPVAGCFLKDRTKVIVSGMRDEDGGFGLYEVDLGTGGNRRLGAGSLAGGMTLCPTLSTDGKTLAAVHWVPGGDVFKKQVYLVDLKTAKARPLGEPDDFVSLSWLPDGKGLVVTRLRTVTPDKPSVSSICRMDLQGNITTIRKGGRLVLLADGGTILFTDEADRLWKTCDPEGKDVSLFRDGLRGFFLPSLAPDGRRLIMMRYREGKPPLPVIVGVDGKIIKELDLGPGLWTMPVWR